MAESCNCALASDLLNLYLTQDHADVTFAFGENGNLHAHKSILAARVPRFKELFSGKSGQLTFDVVSDVGKAAFDSFLRFVYSGRITEPGHHIPYQDQLLVLAEEYDVPSLVSYCQMKMVARLSEMPLDFELYDLLPEFEKILAKPTSIAVKDACEKELTKRLDHARSLVESCRRAWADRRGSEFVEQIANIIRLCKAVGFENLAEKCFQHLAWIGEERDMSVKLEPFSEVWKTLKDDAESLFELTPTVFCD